MTYSKERMEEAKILLNDILKFNQTLPKNREVCFSIDGNPYPMCTVSFWVFPELEKSSDCVCEGRFRFYLTEEEWHSNEATADEIFDAMCEWKKGFDDSTDM